MSETYETRHIKWHETCKCKCRLDAIICNNKQRWNKDKCRCGCKELMDKGRCDKGCIWNPSNCEYECDKSCYIGQYLDYKNCKCRKKLDDKLVKECSENIDGNEMIDNVNDYEKVCNSCTIYLVLFAIAFLIIIGISSAFIHFHWYLMINIKDLNSNLLKIDKKSYKNIDIYYIGYIAMKGIIDYESIHSVNHLYFIVGKVDGYIEGKNGNKYLVFASTDKNKEILEKYTELWDRIKSLIKKISDKPGEYGKDFMKIKFNSDHNLPLNKTFKFYNLTIIVRSVFEEDNKYYPQFFFDECLYDL